ncbi:hypothetical protein AYI69_g4611, partial [Smittium culicis]
MLPKKALDTLNGIGEVTDTTSFKHVNFNSYPPRSLKIILKTKNDKEIPSSLNINDTEVLLVWKGGQ